MHSRTISQALMFGKALDLLLVHIGAFQSIDLLIQMLKEDFLEGV